MRVFFDSHDGLAGQPIGATPAVQTHALLGWLAEGIDGTKQTLRVMRGLVRDSIRSPSQTIRRTADAIIHDSGVSPGNAKNWTGEIRVLHAFVRDHIRYVMDPNGVEMVQTPEKTLEFASGDCDDKSTLLAALLESVGHPARFWAVGFNHDSEFSHVLVETLVGQSWVPLETILDVDVGWRPPAVTQSYRLNL